MLLLPRLKMFTGSVIPLGIWINIESSIGIVCICLPGMRPLLRVMIPESLRSFFCRSQDGSKDSYTLTDQSNIRGRLQRIPSEAPSNTTLAQDRNILFKNSQHGGSQGTGVASQGTSARSIGEIVPVVQPYDVERQQGARNPT